MAVNYDRARATAQRVINRFGGPGQIISKGKSGGKSAFGDSQADTPDTIINGIITPLVQFKTSEVDGTSVLTGDSWVIWQTDDTTQIKVDMQITINSTEFSIKKVSPLSSIAGINILVRLNLRSGNG